MKLKTLRYDVKGGAATVTLDRPESRNALNLAMCTDLVTVATAARDASDIGLVLIRGNGPVFCAGADLKERQGMSDEEARARRIAAFDAYEAIESLPVPVIAVVHGSAIGSGVEIACCCDFVVATPAASFATPEASRGTLGVTQRLPRIIGKQLAKDMMFTGRRLKAEEACAAGLVTRVVAIDALEDVIAEIVKKVIAAPQTALRLGKRCIDEGTALDLPGGIALERAAMEESIAQGSWRAGMSKIDGGKV
jgi:enoyl-CoA hydratase